MDKTFMTSLQEETKTHLVAKLTEVLRRFRHESNDTTTREMITILAEKYVKDINPAKAIAVCDESNNSEEGVVRNERFLDVYFAMAEGEPFHQLSFHAIPEGIDHNLSSWTVKPV